LLLSRIYRLAPYFHILVTFGLTLVIEEAVRLFWSAAPQRVETPAMLKGLSFIGPFFYPNYRLFVIGCACVCAAGLWFLLERTRFGARIRAGSENRDMVLLLGIDIDRLLTANFVLGAGLAALAGALVSPIRGVDPAMGTEALGTAFIVCVVGGLGSFRGAIVAALLVGIVQSYATSLWGAGAGIVAYLAMVAVLLARPEGLFGAAEAIAR
jgi:branched-chain amino acid transport system permease protein